MGKEEVNCPKCGSGLLSRNEDGDLECLCGKIIYGCLDEPEPRPVSKRYMPVGRPRTGETLKCVDCGKEIYVRKYRFDKDPEAERRCSKCAKKHFLPPRTVKKEVTMQEHEPKEMNRKEKSRFIKEHREEILEDIGRLERDEVCKKWGFSVTKYFILKREVEKQPTTSSSKPDEVVELSEHERYLVLLGWQQAAREFLKLF